MYSRYFLIGVILAFFAVATALADGGFYGSITYKNCNCVFPPDGDRVLVRPFGGGEYPFGVDCLRDAYSTTTFPPGWYTLIVDPGDGTKCYFGVPRTVYHGDQNQEVNLEVEGPEIMPDGGDQ